jgi:hypothetical protein
MTSVPPEHQIWEHYGLIQSALCGGIHDTIAANADHHNHFSLKGRPYMMNTNRFPLNKNISMAEAFKHNRRHPILHVGTVNRREMQGSQ